MNWNTRRARGWLKARVRSVRTTLTRKRSIGEYISIILTVLAVGVVTVKPGKRVVEYGTFQTLFILLSALYLKFSEKFKRLRSIDAPKSHSWRERQAQLADVIEHLIRLDARDRNRPDKILFIRSSILICVVSSIGELLEESGEAFCASLLVFPGSRSDREAAGPTQMLVAARSSAIRPPGKVYPCDDHLVAWRAVVESDVKVVDDVRESDHFINARKSYRSVLAIPVTIGGDAFGTLSIDSSNAYQFVNRHEDLAFVVRPYLSLLAYTFPSDAVSVPCTYRSTQVSSPSD